MSVVVPPIVSPLVVSPGVSAAEIAGAVQFGEVDAWSVASPELTEAWDLALADCESQTDYVQNIKFETPPKTGAWLGATAASWTQRLRLLIGAYNDERKLSETEKYFCYSPMGSLPIAIGRAIARNSIRGADGAAPILEIGAGQRLVAWGLKAIYGDAIRIHELSPRYSKLQGVMDMEHPPAKIENATLPPDFYECAFSIFGTIYGDDQVEVLQKVVDTMRVGGEAFLMWKIGLRNYRLTALARMWPALFQQNGLDLSVEMVGYGGAGDMPESLHIVWARKRKSGVDVRSIFDRARELSAKSEELLSGEDGELLAARKNTVRLSPDGPYFASREIEPFLPSLVEGMVHCFCDSLGTNPVEMRMKLQDIRYGESAEMTSRQAVGRLVHHIMVNHDFMESLHNHFPLSTFVAQVLHRVIPVLCSDTTVLAERIKIMNLMANMRH